MALCCRARRRFLSLFHCSSSSSARLSIASFSREAAGARHCWAWAASPRAAASSDTFPFSLALPAPPLMELFWKSPPLPKPAQFQLLGVWKPATVASASWKTRADIDRIPPLRGQGRDGERLNASPTARRGQLLESEYLALWPVFAFSAAAAPATAASA